MKVGYHGWVNLVSLSSLLNSFFWPSPSHVCPILLQDVRTTPFLFSSHQNKDKINHFRETFQTFFPYTCSTGSYFVTATQNGLSHTLVLLCHFRHMYFCVQDFMGCQSMAGFHLLSSNDNMMSAVSLEHRLILFVFFQQTEHNSYQLGTFLYELFQMETSAC